jgi:hypothetical protein
MGLCKFQIQRTLTWRGVLENIINHILESHLIGLRCFFDKSHLPTFLYTCSDFAGNFRQVCCGHQIWYGSIVVPSFGRFWSTLQIVKACEIRFSTVHKGSHISLYVSIEAVEVLQAMFINKDIQMYDEATCKSVQAWPSKLIEELRSIRNLCVR